jgi:hypothetical protein
VERKGGESEGGCVCAWSCAVDGEEGGGDSSHFFRTKNLNCAAAPLRMAASHYPNKSGLKMIAYKIAKNGETRVIVTLEIPSDALTNESRASVVVRETAKHRTNKAKVLAIEDLEGKRYDTATSCGYNNKRVVYTMGEWIEEPSYDRDPEKVCAEGIHYFLARRVAELYRLDWIQNGLFQEWHENGRKSREVTFVDGKMHGTYQEWHENGQKQAEGTYVEGKVHGTYQEWHENGQKGEEMTYVEGKLHGPYLEWNEKGEKVKDVVYVHGVVQ